MLPHISTLDNKFSNMKDEVINTEYSQLPRWPPNDSALPLFSTVVCIMSLKECDLKHGLPLLTLPNCYFSIRTLDASFRICPILPPPFHGLSKAEVFLTITYLEEGYEF